MKKRFANTVFESVDRYIDYCRKKLQATATEFCQALDMNLNPIVFVIAVNCRKNIDGKIFHVCPENIDYSWLAETEKKAQDLFRDLNASKTNLVDPRPIIAKGLIEAPFKGVALSADKIMYASQAMMIEDFAVFAICMVNSLPIVSRNNLVSRNNAVTSLIDGAIKQFLKSIPPFFYQELDPGSIFKGTALPSSYEIIRSAGKNLLLCVSLNFPPNEKIEENIPELGKSVTLFDDVNAISRAKYENEKAVGSIAIVERTHQNLEVLLEFVTPVWTHNLRASRKLLEMSNDTIHLLYWAGDFYGLGQLTGNYTIENEDLFVVKIRDHYVWSLHHGEHTLMVVSYEQPRLYADEQVDYVIDFHKALEGVFFQVRKTNKDRLTDLFKMALQQKHGTMLVILDEAQAESVRLRTQSTQIKPSAITETLMRTITAIDGAVILDPTGTCHAIGAILDGEVAEGEGDPGRGARFNAASKYLNHCKRKGFKCLLAVISEDGMVNIFSTQPVDEENN